MVLRRDWATRLPPWAFASSSALLPTTSICRANCDISAAGNCCGSQVTRPTLMQTCNTAPRPSSIENPSTSLHMRSAISRPTTSPLTGMSTANFDLPSLASKSVARKLEDSLLDHELASALTVMFIKVFKFVYFNQQHSNRFARAVSTRNFPRNIALEAAQIANMGKGVKQG